MNHELKIEKFPSGQILYIIEGDITQENVDAIVNPANSRLMHGGGLAAIIARKGGPAITQESQAWIKQNGPISHEKPAYTSGGNLPCRYIIHAVGPIWGSGNEDRKLAAAISGALNYANELKLGSIAIPAVSTGIFGFPKDRAARIIFQSIRKFFNNNPGGSLTTVRVVLFGSSDANVFLETFEQGNE